MLATIIKTMQFVPIELYQLVSNLLNTISQIRMGSVSKFLHRMDIFEIKTMKIRDDILMQKKFNNLVTLDYCRKMELNNKIHWFTQKSINRLNLVKLYICDNDNINDVWHMSNLRVLNICGKCSVTQNGIKNLDLIELYARDNEDIRDVSYMRNLKILYANFNITLDDAYGIEQNSIKNLDLIKLNISNNYNIDNISHMINLKYLNISGECSVGQDSMQKLLLKKLNATNNIKIKDVSFMTTLRKLNISGICGVGQASIPCPQSGRLE